MWGSEFTSKAAKRFDLIQNPSGTEANAAGRSLRARVALESAREVS